MDLNSLKKISGNFANYHFIIVVTDVLVLDINILIVIAVLITNRNFADNGLPNALPLMSSKLLVGFQMSDLDEDYFSFSFKTIPIISTEDVCSKSVYIQSI